MQHIEDNTDTTIMQHTEQNTEYTEQNNTGATHRTEHQCNTENNTTSTHRTTQSCTHSFDFYHHTYISKNSIT